METTLVKNKKRLDNHNNGDDKLEPAALERLQLAISSLEKQLKELSEEWDDQVGFISGLICGVLEMTRSFLTWAIYTGC